MATPGRKPGCIKTGGRIKGTPNKATADLRAVAGVYTEAAIHRLAILAGLVNDGEGRAESEQAQIMACNSLLDRSHGKPSQHVHQTGSVTLEQLVLQAVSLRNGEVEQVSSEESVH